jgi:hypothetical protein
MKKLIIFSFTLLLLAGCTRDLPHLNNDPKHPTTVPSYTLFSQAQFNLASTLATPNVNTNIFELIAQYWQETTYLDESNYDLGTRAIPDNWWNALYRNVLNNLQLAKGLVPTDVIDPDEQKNDLAMIDILQVYTYYYIVNTYGDIPYTQALDASNPFPKYDDAKTVESDLITRLDADIAALDAGAGSFGSADLIYSGDISAWKKFANSIKLKIGILMADVDPGLAKSTVESAVASGVFTSNDDNALFVFSSSPPNTNPIWVNLVQSGRLDFVANSTIVDIMKGINDPRLPYYFTFDANGDYSGGDPGQGSTFSLYSKPAGLTKILYSDATDIGRIADPDFPGDLLDYSEVEFYLAEAAARNFNVGGTAEEHYNKAITASITYWGGSDADAAAYLAQPSVAYATAAGDWKKKIGTQAYIAFYTRGYEGWTEFRRLDEPSIQAPPSALSEFPVRYLYPVKEENVNQPNYEAASSAIGGDEVTTKLFWDKN